jgi:hypothetical protein
MATQKIKKAQKGKIEVERGWFYRLSKHSASVIVTGILGAIAYYALAQWLPGPVPRVFIQGLAEHRHEEGCMLYMVHLSSREPLEQFYYTLQFPADLQDLRVVEGELTQDPDSEGRTSISAFGFRRNSTGECSIVRTIGLQTFHQQATRVGSAMVTVQGTKLPPRFYSDGGFLILSGAPNPTLNNIYTEGTYEYSKLGISVKKQLTFEHGDVTISDEHRPSR